MPYKNIEDKRARDRAHHKERSQLDKKQNETLFMLYDAFKTGEIILETEEIVQEDHTPLIGLAKRKLAKKVDRGLWRITLAGVLHVRRTYQVT